MNRIHRAFATFLMLACTFAGSIDGSFVICLGADGHVSVEHASDGCCGAGLERDGQRPDRAVGTDGSHSRVATNAPASCGRCIDLPLVSGTGARFDLSKLSVPTRAAVSQLPPAMNLAFSSIWTARNQSRTTVDPASTALTHQRTVVLRC